MKIKATIIITVLSVIVFENNCNAFYRPLPRLVENTLNKILSDQLDRRFVPNKMIGNVVSSLLKMTFLSLIAFEKMFDQYILNFCSKRRLLIGCLGLIQ